MAVAGTLGPGQTITLDLTGATPSAATFLLFGPVPGTTAIHLGPFGSFTVGLSWPFAIQPIGQTNGSGHLSYSVAIPNFPGTALLPSLTLQTVTVAPASGLPLLSFCVSNTAALVAAPFGARAALLHWHRTALGANALDHTPSTQGPLHLSGQQIGPCRTARALAIVHIAMFEALIAIEGGYQSYVGLAPVTAPTSRPAAIAQAGHDALAALYPSQAWIFDAELATDLASIPNTAAKSAGIMLGHAAAAAILGQRAADGSNHAEPLVNTEFVCSNLPGHWRQDPIVAHPLALGAGWPQVAPFAMTSAAQFRVPAPPAMTSPAFTAAFGEVKALGGDGITTPTVRTADQTRAGIFWSYDGTPSLGTPPRLYNQIVLQIALQQGTSVIGLARLLALVNIAMADTGLAVWDSKYFHQFWRPTSGIREADPATGPTGLGDGNPDTIGDLAFSPLGAPASNTANPNFTPPFPAYPSGHAGFGGAVFQTLRRFLHTDVVPFTFVSDELNGVTLDNQGTPRPLAPRSYLTLSQAEEENGQSRIYLGIHWSFDKTAGIVQGRSVADWVIDHVYRPMP
ncbi:MAG: phosphatase PAP2 family protein [Planctomycetes bacterium]|nr:phosphatase PAP2 family protein [Planctomycetota bacterium]